eukprot:TRINITY_DN9917_c0_g1_i4.p1 TRINITY_DN9917_c0_g1~~TRINITY_DN9917_c0_g1_i4.p1  ORF type:complete len:253 (+),score=57.60 TRINITY_DN9917_c0_g1_i4:113-871(+)
MFGFFFFKQKTAYEMQRGLVGSEMCIRDSINAEYMGHKNIGYMDASYITMNHVNRVKAFENSMKNLNPNYNPDWITQVDCNKDIYQSSYDTVQELIRKFPEITAIVTVNDSVAIGATKGIWDCGMKIPEDMSIIGFDNYRQVKFIHPSLTTINQPIREMGFTAAKSIDEFLKNPGTWNPPREIFPTELIVRESTAPPRQITVQQTCKTLTKEIQHEKGYTLHTHRTPRRDRHHRHPRCNALTRADQGKRKSL